MSQVKSKNTKPEQLICRQLFAHGYQYQKNDKQMSSKLDIYLPKYKTVFFVNGCFEHGHKNCDNAKLPEPNMNFGKTRSRKILSEILKYSSSEIYEITSHSFMEL